MNVKQGISCAGHALWRVEKADGTVRISNAGDNLVLDSLYTRFMNPAQSWSVPSIKLGSGTTPPESSQTDLVNYGITLSGVSQSLPQPSISNGLITAIAVLTKDSGIGGATGTWTELGLSWEAGVQTRLLFTDVGGSPTAITVLADEKLIITYTLNWKFSLIDEVITQTIAGESRQVTIRTAGITGWNLNNLLRGRVASHCETTSGGTMTTFGAAGVEDGRDSNYTTLHTGELMPDLDMITSVTIPTNLGNGLINGLRDGSTKVYTGGNNRFFVRTKYFIDPPFVKTDDETLTMRYQVTRSRM